MGGARSKGVGGIQFSKTGISLCSKLEAYGDADEVLCLEGSATDKTAVDVRTCEKLLCV